MESSDVLVNKARITKGGNCKNGLAGTLALHGGLSWSQTSDQGEITSVSCGNGIAFTHSGLKSPGK